MFYLPEHSMLRRKIAKKENIFMLQVYSVDILNCFKMDNVYS